MIKNNDKNCYFYGLGHCMVDFFVPNVDDSIFSKLKANSPLHLDKEEFSDFFSNFDVKIKKTGGTTVNILKTTGTMTEEELDGTKQVLNAAALTYVAALLVSILNFLRFLLSVLLSRQRD